LNKVDLLPDPDEVIDLLGREFDDAVPTSAETGWGVRELLARVETVLNRSMTPAEALIPYSAGELVNQWHVHGLIEEEEHLENGVRIKGLLPAELAGRMEMYTTRRRGIPQRMKSSECRRVPRHTTANEKQRMPEGDAAYHSE
jgi:GTP-binding protein HflX